MGNPARLALEDLMLDTSESSIWFALAADGELWCLCDCGDFEAAEESAEDMGIDALWILDEAAARQWQARLNQVLAQ